jgi:CxxC-x17-CxxC domain-containing protein
MISKTPKFDVALDEILDKLVPHTRTCKWKGMHKYCEGEFEIKTEDINFLKMLRVPPPNFCPTCRRIRRLLHMNQMRLFKRKCNAPNHDEMMISILSEECPFPVYDYKYFIGDEFDPFSFGIEYKEGNSPMEILFELRKKFPMPSFLNRDPSSINSDYSNGGRDVKNGYYVFGCYHDEDIWYSNLISRSRNIMDSNTVRDSEFVYEGLYSDHLYKSSFIYFSNNCIDSMFLFDCHNCQDCFGCVNLRNARFNVFNEQLSKEKYEEFIKSIYPLSQKALSNYEEKFWKLVKALPANAPRNIVVNNVCGINLVNCKNLYDVIRANDSENICHADGALTHKDSMDFLFSGGNSSLLYMTTNIGSQSSRVKFSVSSKFCTDCEFIFNSKNLNNCFMCFGLQNKSYCVLNKQYNEEEYYKIVDKIKIEMLKRGEYSDGTDFKFSAQAYNFSLAQISYPLENGEIIKLGGYIAQEPESNVGDIEVVKYSNIPNVIGEVMDNILNKAILCEKSNKPFRITESELGFYRRMNLPLPNMHPSLRIGRRLSFVAEGKKYKAICTKCGKEIESLFDPKENYILYCEDCYKREVV